LAWSKEALLGPSSVIAVIIVHCIGFTIRYYVMRWIRAGSSRTDMDDDVEHDFYELQIISRCKWIKVGSRSGKRPVVQVL
jgi:hypothetical protein